MLFNSLEFLLFFPIVTFLYFLLPYRFRWGLLLSASCVFYMTFIPAYILVIFTTILIDYFAGIYIESSSGGKRRLYLVFSILSTCIVLFIFKYFNFFTANINAIASHIHWNYSLKTLEIVLPIGLSFHTFQSLSYVIEVYRGNQKAEKHFGIYSLYVMFYPQLVAGPIERPQNILHQLRENHDFDYENVKKGLLLMTWGFFKKVVIADRLAYFVNLVYDHPVGFSGGQVLVATIFFAIQIYCDFSGYSDIAIGSAKVMGYDLMKNFDTPYFAKSISEFWKRWHISLSTWFRDYLYIPLGGKRVGKFRWLINLLLTFLVSGLWHGASWMFIVWGFLHGFYLVFGIISQPVRDKINSLIGLNPKSKLDGIIQCITTFILVSFAWIFFRANNMQDAFLLIKKIGEVHLSDVSPGMFGKQEILEFTLSIFFIIVLLIVDRMQRRNKSFDHLFENKPVFLRSAIYVLVINVILFFGIFSHTDFIYFQF